MESSLNDGSGMPRTLWTSEYLWSHCKFLAEPESIGNVIDLYGFDNGDLYSAERAEVHQYRVEVILLSYRFLR
ncbi:MAG: hypothetical protein RLZZ477_775 [Actinomycetota bacterium]